jgi:hypothetical protein
MGFFACDDDVNCDDQDGGRGCLHSSFLSLTVAAVRVKDALRISDDVARHLFRYATMSS